METDAIVAEMADQLRAWAVLPRREQIVRLWMLGLEREQLVAVAYGEDRMATRLAGMAIPDEVRRVALHALRWVWRDEQAHTVYVRGVLERRGPFTRRLRASLARVRGGVAGWCSAVQHHYRWRDAPLARLVAETLEWGGRLGGVVPPKAGEALHFQSFAAYCRFNVAIETTAEMAWRRLLELAASDGVWFEERDQLAFARMAEDEARHAALFRVLAAAFDPEDRLEPGWDAARLEASIGAIDPSFLPGSRPGIGFGGRVQVVQGTQRGERRTCLGRLLHESVLGERIRPGMRVAIKTTFMRGTHTGDRTPVVHAGTLRELAEFLVGRGATGRVIEAPTSYERFHRGRRVPEVAAYFGLDGPFEWVDAREDQVGWTYPRGLAQHTLCETWATADFRIVLGKLASHPVDFATLTLAALQGLGEPAGSMTYADRLADRAPAVLMTVDAAPPDFAILDAWEDVADGVAGVLGCPWPATPMRFWAGEDALAVDRIAARDLGMPRSAPLLAHAVSWFGDPLPSTWIDGVDALVTDFRGPHHTQGSSLLALLAFPLFERTRDRGSLFVPRVDTEAFPPRESVSPALAGARSAVRRLLDLA